VPEITQKPPQGDPAKDPPAPTNQQGHDPSSAGPGLTQFSDDGVSLEQTDNPSTKRAVNRGKLLTPLSSGSGSISDRLITAHPGLLLSDFGFLNATLELFKKLAEPRLRKRNAEKLILKDDLRQAMNGHDMAFSPYTALMLDAGLIERVSRGTFKITEAGFRAHAAEQEDEIRGISLKSLHDRALRKKLGKP